MMKRTLLAIACMAAMPASAVHLSPDTGQVLIGPFYTVQNGQETLLSVVNTTNDTKAVKVRFLEAVNSRDVLDWNLYLSPYDVWTAKITADPDTGGAKVVSLDNSCTVPKIPAGGEPFRKIAYDGTHPDYPLDGGDTSYDRLREGHFEIVEMGIADVNNLGDWDRTGNGVADSTHVAGVPERCETFIENWTTVSGGWDETNPASLDTLPPTGGLFGSVSIIDVQVGTEFTAEYTILDDFAHVPIHFRPGTLRPDLRHAVPPISEVRATDGSMHQSVWPLGIDAVSAVLMANRIFQEFSVNPVVEAESAWVVSYPTKHEYVDLDVAGGLGPFYEEFHDGHSCDRVREIMYDREEAFEEGDLDFSPMPPAQEQYLCYETNIVNFNGADPLSAGATGQSFNTSFNSGWGVLGFQEVNNQMTSLDGDTYHGLPVIGFKVTKLGNSNVGIGASYAKADAFKYHRTISGSGE